jgi:hypothetical protein
MFGSDYPVAMNDPFKIYAAVRRWGIFSSAKKNILEGRARNFILRFKPDFSNWAYFSEQIKEEKKWEKENSGMKK